MDQIHNELMEDERIRTREAIFEIGFELAELHDRIMASIHKSESEKQALRALRKFKTHLEVFERQNFAIGRQN